VCGNLWWFRFYSLLILEIHYASQKKSSRKRYQSELARRFREDLILDGKEPRSVQSYLAAVAHLAEHFRCSPERLSEEQIRQHLLLRSQTLKRNSMRPILAGIQFFYRVTVPRDWKTLAAARIPKTRTLPAVLMPQQVWRVIEATRLVHFQVFFRTAYTCGLRPGDTRHLTVDDVDSDRMLLQVRTTKGRNDRCVPLPRATLEALRAYWLTHRNSKWLFPGRSDLKNIATATKPISDGLLLRRATFGILVLCWCLNSESKNQHCSGDELRFHDG
jgi:integrase